MVLRNINSVTDNLLIASYYYYQVYLMGTL